MGKPNRLSIGFVNGIEITAVELEAGKILVPMRPICEALGVYAGGQIEKAKKHPLYAPTIQLSCMVGADGREREMVCIDLESVFGWIHSIHPDNVSEKARETLMEYQHECNHVLFAHFVNKAQRQIEANQAEIAVLKEINECLESEKEARSRRKDAEKRLAKIRASRLDEQPSLFD